MERKIVIFALDKTQCAVDITAVKEIITYPAVAKVPDVPEYVVGIANLRGHATPIIEIGPRLGLSPDHRGKGLVLIIEKPDSIIGVVVDGVSAVSAIDDEQLEPLPTDKLSPHAHGFVTGVVRVGEKLVLLLDIYTVLDFHDLPAVAPL